FNEDGRWNEEEIRFYDEREWRYIPEIKNTDEPFWVNIEVAKEPDGIDSLNRLISDNSDLRLSFEPNDIKFIVVKKENEILSMLDKVINIKRDKFSYRDVQILTTRIISMEGIRENF
ncbi:hypothetical protein LCGC14_2091250, partial [marine sediment metagenome]